MARKKKRAGSAKRKSIFLWLVLLVVLVAAGFAALQPATESVYRQLYPRTYREYVERYSREYQVDRDLVYAVAKVESNFDPNAVSHADARGVMQMTEEEADERIQAQHDEEYYKSRSWQVLENNGSINELKNQTSVLLSKLEAEMEAGNSSEAQQ